MIYKSFDVVVVPFPFVDSLQSKSRPALVLSCHDFHVSGLIVLAMITSAHHKKKSIDVPIQALLPTGLSAASMVRMKIFTLDACLVRKKIGALSSVDKKVVSLLFKKMFVDLV